MLHRDGNANRRGQRYFEGVLATVKKRGWWWHRNSTYGLLHISVGNGRSVRYFHFCRRGDVAGRVRFRQILSIFGQCGESSHRDQKEYNGYPQPNEVKAFHFQGLSRLLFWNSHSPC